MPSFIIPTKGLPTPKAEVGIQSPKPKTQGEEIARPCTPQGFEADRKMVEGPVEMSDSDHTDNRIGVVPVRKASDTRIFANT